ncbi:EAL domain-containing protein [Acidithiobacillus thiooxidans]|uniref:EAL domain-containing protein n=1 Tax=Acidithiobacillus thiooxidans TaxID=930 RepID=UPI0004E0D864|nr:EAL domain-containing protein [Acidithiobacillus thiooxidans]
MFTSQSKPQKQSYDHRHHIELIAQASDRAVLGCEILCRSDPFPETLPDWIDWITHLVELANQTATPDYFASINVDGWNLHHPQIMNILQKLTGDAVVEWTERPDKHSTRKTALKLRELQAKTGVRLSIDDVGAGIDGIQRILLVEPDFIKIDGQIIQEATINQNPMAFAAIDSLLNLAQKAGALAVAEWIESEIEWEVCKKCGIDLVQGYYVQKSCNIQNI